MMKKTKKKKKTKKETSFDIMRTCVKEEREREREREKCEFNIETVKDREKRNDFETKRFQTDQEGVGDKE